MRQIIPGIFVLHRGRIPGFSNWRARMPGGPELEGQNTWKIRSEGQITSTTFLQHWTRLPGGLQITWSRPKVGQIAWARAWSIGEGRRGEGRGEDGDGVLTRTISSAGHAVVRGSWKRASRPLFFWHPTSAASHPGVSSTDPRPFSQGGAPHRTRT